MIDIIMIIALALLPGMMDYEISEIEKEIEIYKEGQIESERGSRTACADQHVAVHLELCFCS